MKPSRQSQPALCDRPAAIPSSIKPTLPQLDEATVKVLRQRAWPLLSQHPLAIWRKGSVLMKVGESEVPCSSWPSTNTELHTR